jgi:hypothetical protein
LSKIDSTKINASFLAIVLIVGTFVAISPSFIDAEATGDKRDNYIHKDNRYDKSKSVNVKKIVCNQNNIDVGGIGIDLQRGDISSTLTEGQTQEEGNQEVSTNSMGNDERNQGYQKHDNKDIVFVCVNNNISPELPVEECTEAEANAIEVCFEENMSSRDFGLLTNALGNGITVEIEEGNSVTLNSFADICKALKGITTWEQLFTAVLIITDEFSDPTAPVAISNDLIDCIAEALGIPLPSPPPGG